MNFHPEERALLGRLADVLIPAGENFPSASQAGVSAEGLDQVLVYRPDLAAPLRKILSLVTDLPPAKVVAQLKASHPELFAALTDFVPGAYFLNPQVRTQLSYRGQAAHPLPADAEDLEGELLRPVIDRGPIYRVRPQRETGS